MRCSTVSLELVLNNLECLHNATSGCWFGRRYDEDSPLPLSWETKKFSSNEASQLLGNQVCVRKDKIKVLSASMLPTAGNQLGKIHLAISVSKPYVCNGRRNRVVRNFAQCNPFPASYLTFRRMGQDTAGRPLHSRIFRAPIKPLYPLIPPPAITTLWYHKQLSRAWWGHCTES